MGRYAITGLWTESKMCTLEDLATGETFDMDQTEMMNNVISGKLDVINARNEQWSSRSLPDLWFMPADDYYLEEFKTYNRALMLDATIQSDKFGNIQGCRDERSVCFITECNNILHLPISGCETVIVSSRKTIGSGGSMVKCKNLTFKTAECLKGFCGNSRYIYYAETVRLEDKTEKVDANIFRQTMEVMTLIMAYGSIKASICEADIRWQIIWDIPVNISSEQLIKLYWHSADKIEDNGVLSRRASEIGHGASILVAAHKAQIGIAAFNAALGLSDSEKIEEIRKYFLNIAIDNLTRLDDIVSGTLQSRLQDRPLTQRKGIVKDLFLSYEYPIVVMYNFIRKYADLSLKSIETIKNIIDMENESLWQVLDTAVSVCRF